MYSYFQRKLTRPTANHYFIEAGLSQVSWIAKPFMAIGMHEKERRFVAQHFSNKLGKRIKEKAPVIDIGPSMSKKNNTSDDRGELLGKVCNQGFCPVQLGSESFGHEDVHSTPRNVQANEKSFFVNERKVLFILVLMLDFE